jgi:hypothetical protein
MLVKKGFQEILAFQVELVVTGILHPQVHHPNRVDIFLLDILSQLQILPVHLEVINSGLAIHYYI